MMPDVDGFALVELLRADERTAHIPVVMLSARAGEGAVAEGLDRGADDYLVKPFASSELVARVRARARSGRRGDATTASAAPRRAAAPAPPPSAAEAHAPVVVASEDDAALVLRVASNSGSIGPARRKIIEYVSRYVGGDRLSNVQLAISEAVTNAVEHAVDPEPPVIDVVVTPTPVLRVAIRDHGRWRPRIASMDRGRGSTIMSALADVEVVPHETGTIVTLTFSPEAGGAVAPVR